MSGHDLGTCAHNFNPEKTSVDTSKQEIKWKYSSGKNAGSEETLQFSITQEPLAELLLIYGLQHCLIHRPVSCLFHNPAFDAGSIDDYFKMRIYSL